MTDNKTADDKKFDQTTWKQFAYAIHDETKFINKDWLKAQYRNKDERTRGKVIITSATVAALAAMSSSFILAGTAATAGLAVLGYSIKRRISNADPVEKIEVDHRADIRLDTDNNQASPNGSSKTLILDVAQEMIDHTGDQVKNVAFTQKLAPLCGMMGGFVPSVFLVPVFQNIALNVSGPNTAAAAIAVALIAPAAYGYSYFNKQLQKFKKESEIYTKKLDELQKWTDYATENGLFDKLPTSVTPSNPIKIDSPQPNAGATTAVEPKIEIGDATSEAISLTVDGSEDEAPNPLTPGPTPPEPDNNPLTPGPTRPRPSP